MPLIILFVLCIAAAVHPVLLLIIGAIVLLTIPGRRARRLDNAGINAAFGGASMVDEALLKGRRRL